MIEGVGINLGTWARARRSDFRKGQLSAKQIAELEALPGWEWDPREADYQRHLSALLQFVAREGHALVPQKHVEEVDGVDFKIGTWANKKRGSFKKGQLPEERIADLEALPGWEWQIRSSESR